MTLKQNLIYQYYSNLLIKNDGIVYLGSNILNPKSEIDFLLTKIDKRKSYYERMSDYFNQNNSKSFTQGEYKLLKYTATYLGLLTQMYSGLRVNTNVSKKIIPELKKIKQFTVEDNFIWDKNIVNPKFIKDLPTSFKELKSDDKFLTFYRGHSNNKWDLSPSIYRNNWIKKEHSFFRDIQIRNPENFSKAKSTFEKLTIMQHHGLPTRLLDISSNPMVALWFACSDETQVNEPGEIFVFKVKNSEIKYYDSDTVSVISNLSKIERDFEINTYELTLFNKEPHVGKLIHQIKEEKPYFINIINPKDIEKSIIVKPINNSDRIKRQMGYFILVGINKNIREQAEVIHSESKSITKKKYIIPPNYKKRILEELEVIGISSNTLFPEIDNGTEFLKKKY